MDAAVVRQFLDFFQDFLNLCQSENWPNNNTSEAEIKNAFLAAQHVEKCLDRFQKRNLINEFLSAINSNNEPSNMFLRHCFKGPAKYVLKKIINSNTKISQMDVGIKVFLELFAEDKLEKYLTDVMLESASKETLLRNMSTEFPREKLIEFKSQLLLMELSTSESKESLLNLLQNPDKDIIALLVVSLLNNDFKYYNSVQFIVNAFTHIMSRKNQMDKLFWKLLFRAKDYHLVQMSLKHGDLFKMMATALLDCGKLLREQISAEYFYIDLTYSELVFTSQKIFENDNLKVEFLDLVRENNADVEFWEKIIP